MSSDIDHQPQPLIIISNDSPKIKPSVVNIEEKEEEAQEEITMKVSNNNTAATTAIILLSNINDELDLHTPTEDENKIPTTLTPPPAPRKPVIKRKGIACKRKLFGEINHQVSHHQIVNKEEVDAFFKSSFESLAGKSAMIVKRCKCT